MGGAASTTSTTKIEYADNFVFDWSIEGSLNEFKILTGQSSIISENFKSPDTKNTWQLIIDEIKPKIPTINSTTTVSINLKLINYGHPSIDKTNYGFRYESTLTYDYDRIQSNRFDFNPSTNSSEKIEKSSNNVNLIEFKLTEMTIPLYTLSDTTLQRMKNVHIKGRIQSEPQIVIENGQQKFDGSNKNIADKGVKMFSKILEYYPEDIEVICKKSKFIIHKYLLTAQSEVFAKMFEVNLRENQKNQKKRINQIVIEDFEPEIVQIFCDYLRNFSNSIEVEKKLEKFGWEKTREIFKMSHMYEIEDLKNECEALMCKKIDLQNAFEILELSKLYNLSDLENSTMKFISSKKRSPEILAEFDRLAQENPRLLAEIQSDVWKSY